MITVLHNNDSFCGTYGEHVFSCYPNPLFSGSFPCLSSQYVVGVLSFLATFSTA